MWTLGRALQKEGPAKVREEIALISRRRQGAVCWSGVRKNESGGRK